MNTHVRDALIALSLANLSFIGLWDAFLNYTAPQSFLLEYAPSASQYGAALMNVFLVGAAFFLLIQIARHFPHAAIPILIGIAIPAEKALVQLANTKLLHFGQRTPVAILLCLIALSVVVARRRTVTLAASLLVTLCPLIPMEAVLAGVRYKNVDPAFASGTLATPQSNHLPRVVWIIFDELDYRLSFPDRPANLAMPQFDRLRAESLFAENAYPPGDQTRISVPSLLIGETLTSNKPRGPAEALLDGAPIGEKSTVFEAVHRMGGNAAVAGWYLPYCRLFSQDLTACTAHDIESYIGETRGTFWESVASGQRMLFEYEYFSAFPQSLMAKQRVRMLDSLHRDALRDVVDPSLNLVFLHLPVPHAPHFYDRRTGTFTKRNGQAKAYPDSLALADRYLGDFRAAMTEAGLWDTTTILVSSDHRDRSARLVDGKEDFRVPFLLKMAGQHSGLRYAALLKTVAARSLIEAILRSKIRTPEDAENWLRNSPVTSLTFSPTAP